MEGYLFLDLKKKRTFTFYDLFIQFILIVFVLILLYDKFRKRLSQFKIFNTNYKILAKILKQNKLFSSLFLKLKKEKKNTLFIIFLTSIILLNNIIISFKILENSDYSADDHGLEDFSNYLEDYANSSSLIFGNNYVRMKTYLTDDFLNKRNFLPFPHTEEEFYKFMCNPPEKSCFYITNEKESTWTESANEYIKEYITKEIINSEQKKDMTISPFNLKSPLAKYKFDDNNSIIKDFSGYGNNGIANNLEIVEGLYYSCAYLDDSLNSNIIINNSIDFIISL